MPAAITPSQQLRNQWVSFEPEHGDLAGCAGMEFMCNNNNRLVLTMDLVLRSLEALKGLIMRLGPYKAFRGLIRRLGALNPPPVTSALNPPPVVPALNTPPVASAQPTARSLRP